MILKTKKTIWIFLILLSACVPATKKFEDVISLPLPTSTQGVYSALPANEMEMVEEAITNTRQVSEIIVPTEAPSGAIPTVEQPVPIEEDVDYSFQTKLGANCVSDQNIELFQLGLSENDQLLLTEIKDRNSGIWMLSEENNEPQKIPNTSVVDGDHIIYQDISPNTHWILFYKWQGENTTNVELWISSIDGQEQRVITIVDLTTHSYAHWLSDELVLLTSGTRSGYPYNGRVSSEYLTMTLLDISDNSVTQLPLLSEGVRPLSTSLSPISKGMTETIYYQDRQLMYYEYLTGETHPLFPWLNELSWFATNPENIYSYLSINMDKDNRFDLAVKRPYGLDIATDIDMTKANASDIDYITIMSSVELQDARETEIRPVRWIPNHNQLVFYKHNSFSAGELNQYHLFLIDFDDRVIHDYCIFQNDLIPPQISDNGKFLAWTVRHEGALQGTVIINLDTGDIVRLDGWLFRGWAKSNQP